MESRGTSVYIIGATNRPDMVDPAMCRPGRLDKLLYVDLPNPEERVEIFRALVGTRTGSTKGKVPILGGPDGEVQQQVEALLRGSRATGYSGADLASLVREAAVSALRNQLQRESETMESSLDLHPEINVGIDDFDRALSKVTPSVSVFQRRRYEMLKDRLAGLPIGNPKTEEERDSLNSIVP